MGVGLAFFEAGGVVEFALLGVALGGNQVSHVTRSIYKCVKEVVVPDHPPRRQRLGRRWMFQTWLLIGGELGVSLLLGVPFRLEELLDVGSNVD